MRKSAYPRCFQARQVIPIVLLVICCCDIELCVATSLNRGSLLRGYPETITRGVTSVGENKISCGRRFFGASRATAPHAAAAIVGGRDADPGEFPFIASLTHGPRDMHFCGGSLVGPQHVLTAAHCLHKPRVNLKVKLREYNIFRTELPPAEEFGVETYALHPEWSVTTLRNDLAIVTLDRPVHMDSYAQPICLPCCPTSSYPGGNDYMVGRSLTVAGWGALKEGGKMSPILQKLDLPVIDGNTCKAKLFPQFTVTETHLCAGYKAGLKDACQGDSGGPLFREEDGFMTLEGVVSAGIGCARPDLPGLYTRVSEYVPWITSSMLAHASMAGGHSAAEPDERPEAAVQQQVSKLDELSDSELEVAPAKVESEIEAFFGSQPQHGTSPHSGGLGPLLPPGQNNLLGGLLNLLG